MDTLIQLDERLFVALNQAGSPRFDVVFRVVTWGGHGLVLALLIVPLMAWLDRARLRAHLLAMILSVVAGALVVEAAKTLAARDRPARHFAASAVVRMPGERLYDRSFPSGHTQSAFGAATYVALLYPPLAIPVIAGASLVGFSRIYLGVHFPVDVAAGAGIGIAFSFLGYRVRQRRFALVAAQAASCAPFKAK